MIVIWYRSGSFNPRSHAGSDSIVPCVCRRQWVSIHAPTQGATVLSSQAFTIEIEFQSTLPRRERRDQTRNSRKDTKVSIHAPTQGATHSRHCSHDLLCRFNPRSHAGSDSNFSQKSLPIFSRNRQIIILNT